MMSDNDIKEGMMLHYDVSDMVIFHRGRCGVKRHDEVWQGALGKDMVSQSGMTYDEILTKYIKGTRGKIRYSDGG